MKTLIDHLSQYADYHRDPRNIHTHFVGVPMIMFAVVILLSRPTWMAGELPLSPALFCALASCVFYFRLDTRFGLAMAAVAGLLSVFSAVPFMTGLWIYPSVLGVEIPLSSVMLFDTGVYLVVVGSITSIALALEAGDDI